MPMQEGDEREFETDLANMFVYLGLCEVVDDKPKRTRKTSGGS